MLTEPEKVVAGVLENIHSAGRYSGRHRLTVRMDDGDEVRLLSPDADIPGQIRFIRHLLSLRGHWLEMSTIIDPSVSRKLPVVVPDISFGVAV